METLLPVRLKKGSNEPCIGDDDEQLTATRGFTKTVVHATAESIVKASSFRGQDQNLVAAAVDDTLLEFENYQEEISSQYGRPVLKIIQDDGLEAYEALGDDAPKNAYLHAALHDISVWKAAQELDTEPQLTIDTDDGVQKVGKSYRSPDLVSAAVIVDGNVYERDLREFVPDVDWVFDNWRTLGGSKTYSRSYKDDESAAEKLQEFVVGTATDPTRAVVNQVEKGFTFHYIKGVEEAVVADETDRLVAWCGASFEFGNQLALEVDTDSVDSSYECSNCA